jgi:hypothetical protein
MRNAAVMLSDYHHACHPERSEAQSKDPAKLLFGMAMGFLDFARNADEVIRHSIIRISFDIRHSCFVIS